LVGDDTTFVGVWGKQFTFSNTPAYTGDKQKPAIGAQTTKCVASINCGREGKSPTGALGKTEGCCKPARGVKQKKKMDNLEKENGDL